MSKPMISDLVKWQLEKIESHCRLLLDHATDPTCSCELDLTSCLRKHCLTIKAYAEETMPLIKDDDELVGLLEELAVEARDMKDKVSGAVCGKGKSDLDLASVATFARTWAKKIESQYTCPVSKNKVKLKEPITAEDVAIL